MVRIFVLGLPGRGMELWSPSTPCTGLVFAQSGHSGLPPGGYPFALVNTPGLVLPCAPPDGRWSEYMTHIHTNASTPLSTENPPRLGRSLSSPQADINPSTVILWQCVPNSGSPPPTPVQNNWRYATVIYPPSASPPGGCLSPHCHAAGRVAPP